MRKTIKLCLALSLIIPTTIVTFNNETTVIAAKVSGNYAYEIVDDNNVKITNYNGADKNVVIPSEIDGKKVTKIGYGAFAECKSIETLVIADTIRTIDAYAFSQCNSIQSIVIPDNVVSIGKYAFAGNSRLKSIRLPKNIRSLSYGTFFDCMSLTEVVLPEGMETIGSVAFGNCKSLTTIQLPSTLVSLDSNAFSDCVMLASIELPEGLTTIGSGAFSGCLSLSSVQLPSTLLSISQSAFKDCIVLQTIDLPENLIAIGYGAFTGCTSLVDIKIPPKVTEISDATFSGCSSLTSIYIADTINSIGGYAFSGCISLEEVYISDSVESIGMQAFSYCRNLKTIRLPKRLKIINESLFRYCDSLESIILPNGVTEIGATAFADCPNLASVSFPTSIKDKAIGSRILSNSNNATMMVSDNSVAHKYARQNNIKFKLIESGINFDQSTLNLKLGEQSKLTVILSPYTILDNSLLTWTSSNPEVASVDSMGNVVANNVGTAIITAKNSNGNAINAEVNVDDTLIPISGVTLSEERVSMQINTSLGLRATINPGNTTMSKVIRWESDNVEVATINSTGSIFARRPGTATIRAVTINGITAECTVEVKSDIKSVSLNQTAMVLDIDTKQSLRATINPNDTTQDTSLTWVSSNERVAIVNQHGEVTTLAPGTATITVKTINNKKAECKVTVTKPVVDIPITSIVLDKKEAELEIGDNLMLQATINPNNTTDDTTIQWTSSNENVAQVNDGEVLAKGEGTTRITAKTSNGLSAICDIVVKRKVIEIERLELNKQQLTLEEGLEETLIATILPASATEDKTLTWTSSNPSIATVREGKVTAIKEGTATIRVSTNNGKEALCEVKVNKKPVPIESVTLDVTSASLKVGKTLKLTAQINPSNTTQDKTLRWTSSDEKIASVDENGNVLAHREGTVQIRVTTSNDMQATCTITIYDVNKTKLKELIDQVRDIDETQYTLDSYHVFDELRDVSNIVYENEDATQKEIDDVYERLQASYLALVARASETQIQEFIHLLDLCSQLETSFTTEEFQTMKNYIEEATALLKIDYANISSTELLNIYKLLQDEKGNLDIVAARNELLQVIVLAKDLVNGDVEGMLPQSIENLKNAILKSEELLNAGTTSIDMLKEATQSLKDAIQECKVTVEKTFLKDFMDICTTYQEDAYTVDSWTIFANAQSDALDVYNDIFATQQEVNDTYQALLDAFVNLKIKVDKSSLISNVEMALDILSHKSEYIASTIKGLEQQVQDAQELIENSNATKEQVKEMNTNVLKAIMKARKKVI
ncbi:leucine-rich repeat protein [Amedibacillus sp. YH-ame10]